MIQIRFQAFKTETAQFFVENLTKVKKQIRRETKKKILMKGRMMRVIQDEEE